MTTNIVYFSLAPTIFAVRFEKSIIILDSFQDRYVSLIDQAATYLHILCEHKFIYENNMYRTSLRDYDEEQLNYWINYFIQKNFIIATSLENRKLIGKQQHLTMKSLSEYKWDHKPSWRPFSQASIPLILQALLQLTKVQQCIKKKGFYGILNMIKERSQPYTYNPKNEEINRLAAAVDAASVLYPKKIFCLAWAATYVIMALKRGWVCNLVIGVQVNPFFAHAWAEASGQVINDDPLVAQVLSTILKEPFGEKGD